MIFNPVVSSGGGIDNVVSATGTSLTYVYFVTGDFYMTIN